MGEMPDNWFFRLLGFRAEREEEPLVERGVHETYLLEILGCLTSLGGDGEIKNPTSFESICAYFKGGEGRTAEISSGGEAEFLEVRVVRILRHGQQRGVIDYLGARGYAINGRGREYLKKN